MLIHRLIADVLVISTYKFIICLMKAGINVNVFLLLKYNKNILVWYHGGCFPVLGKKGN